MIARTDYVCPVCDGDGDAECYCERRGVITEADASAFRQIGAVVRQLPAAPARLEEPCGDCAFRRDSPEQDSGALYSIADAERPFYCHQAMHETADGRYIPLEQTASGVPIGHPICVGWSRARRRVRRR